MQHELKVSNIEYDRLMEGTTTFLIREKGVGIQKMDSVKLMKYQCVDSKYKYVGDPIEMHVGDTYSMDNDHIAFSLFEGVDE